MNFVKWTAALVHMIKEELKGYDMELKVNSIKEAVMLLLNSKALPALLITIVRFVLRSEDHTIQKPLLSYLRVIDDTGAKSKFLPETILICENL